MPYMPCNQSECNETVKLPAQYCAKHQPSKLSESMTVQEPESVKVLKDTTNLVLLNKANKTMNTKKTTK